MDLTHWEKEARKIDWTKPRKETLEWNPPFAKWFLGGTLNASYNCIDRHLKEGKGDKIALIWEGEKGEEKTFRYVDLYQEVNRFASVLHSLGIKKGDKVAIYLPLIPEALFSMLACARIGAVHTVVFGGFSFEALKDRIVDAEAKLLITADGGYRKGQVIPLKKMADLALKETPSIQHCLVVQRTKENVSMTTPRDLWLHDLLPHTEKEIFPEEMDAEDLLYILYTSGTTGKPKGILHTTGGYMVGVRSTTELVFDIKEEDVYWCTADAGWVTGHSYVVYGPLSLGATIFMYEGAFDFPDKSRAWRLIEKYKITILYTAPTLIRMFMKWGEEALSSFDLSSLRLLGSVGEPINPEAWNWYKRVVGQNRCPIVDTWWQTETGSIMISPIPGKTVLKAGSATFPLPGINAKILNEKGEECEEGFLAITSPWPSMLRGIHKDPERYIETYWKKWEGRYYFTGDGATQDEEGYFWLMGRVDDVMSVAGHRIGTAEIESALVGHRSVAEAAVVSVFDSIKGEAIVGFVSLKEGVKEEVTLQEELKEEVQKKIGAFARPKRIIFVRDLPKTRSGKIMRRLLRNIGENKILGDTTTLSDTTIIEELKDKYLEE